MSTYTIKDWVDGKDDSGKDVLLTEIIKITNAKKDTWKQAVELGIEGYKKRAAFRKNVDGWLKNEIKKVEKFISDHPEAHQKYTLGEKYLDSIDGHFHEKVKEYYWAIYKQGKGIVIPWIEDDQAETLQRMYIYKSYLPYLKELSGIVEMDRKRRMKKYHSENYWDTASDLHDSGKTWEEVYNHMCSEMKEFGMELRHRNFNSFDSARKGRK